MYVRKRKVTRNERNERTTNTQLHRNVTMAIWPDFQWLKWSCEAGGSPDEARLEQTPYLFHT